MGAISTLLTDLLRLIPFLGQDYYMKCEWDLYLLRSLPSFFENERFQGLTYGLQLIIFLL